MEESRTKNTIRNVRTGAIVQIINKIMAFVVRTVFIRVLDTEYLGVNGLFTNVLTVLSFAELGIGTAIIFNMYKPVANDDKEKIKSLMKLYQRVYNIIGVVVFILGLCVIPFMDIIVKDAPNISENLTFIYLLYLTNTASSYFFTYKKSIISAHQKQSVINNIDSVFYLCKSIFEIAFLIITRNFIVYLLIEIISTLFENIFLAWKANKMYPYLKDKNVKKLSKSESKSIFSNVRALVIYKFGGIIMNSTDNILISMLVNIRTVGFCSNYTLIINSIKSVLLSALNGVTASVGNLNAVGNAKQKETIFYQLTLIDYLIYSFCSAACIVLLNPFISLWLGEDYVLNIIIPISLALSFFIDGMRIPCHTYRTTAGLFQKGKATPYIGAISNIVLSVVLCKFMGVAGIFFATSIAQLVSYSWIDPYLIHKYEFKTPLRKYIKKYIIYFLTFSIETALSLFLSYMIPFQGILGLALKALLVLVVPNAINLLVFYRTEEFKQLKKKMLDPMIKKISKKLHKKK